MFNLISISTRCLSRNILLNPGLKLSRCLSNSPTVFSSRAFPDSRCNSNRNLLVFGQRRNDFHTSGNLCKQVVKVPPFADSVSEGDAKLIAKVGEQVKVDQVVMEIETDKTAVPVPAPCDGVIKEILVNDGDTVKPGQDLFTIEPVA